MQGPDLSPAVRGQLVVGPISRHCQGGAGPDHRGRGCGSRACTLRAAPAPLALAVTSARDSALLSLPSFSFCKAGQRSGRQMPFLQISGSGDRKTMTLLKEVRRLEKGQV